ncbi:MAG: hypothetical protein HGA61_01675 [Candidatus Moranbacteria bacterium]|nr:hypothetical protein [Candidatus Moranbacteria bacterium]
MKKQRKTKQKKLKMKLWIKLHSIFTIFLLIFYVALGIFGEFSVLGKDLNSKYAWAAGTAITLFVDGLPGKSVLSSSRTCVNNVSTINLSWTNSEGAITYSITRDGELLASGFQSMAYSDNSVVGGTSYSYIVTAYGTGGESISDPLVVTARDCFEVELPDPVLQLVSFDGKQVMQGVPLSTLNKTFKLTGTTNIPDADIQITTFPGPFFVSTLQANSNGYWEYYLPDNLETGSYYFRITAIDPDELLRSVTEEYYFQINKSTSLKNDDDDEDNDDKDSSKKELLEKAELPRETQKSENIFFDDNRKSNEEDTQNSTSENSAKIVMILKNKAGKIFRSQDAQIDILLVNKLKLKSFSENDVFKLRYEILDRKNMIVFLSEVPERIIGNQLEKAIHIPENLSNGNYRLRVSLVTEKMVYSSESPFFFDDMPVVNLGGGILISYQKLIAYLGWILIISLILLVIFGFMFLMEYYFFRKAISTVDEKGLVKTGMIQGRKGVLR